MRALRQPIHFPEGSPNGPWGVDSIGKSWYVIHRDTLIGRRIGRVGGSRVNNFDRAMEEAHRRNRGPS